MAKKQLNKPKVPKQPLLNFSFKTMNDLYENGQLKERLDCKNYILDYFIPTTKGTHVLNDGDALEILQKDTLRKYI